ncbi:unnamed protein product [marine sediment metagenome]|uniref:Peptidase S1 domain-containing protein n=1 Tax=marine sediment metagenome TaxID=412755 RepID=X1KTX3_9ZZZZ
MKRRNKFLLILVIVIALAAAGYAGVSIRGDCGEPTMPLHKATALLTDELLLDLPRELFLISYGDGKIYVTVPQKSLLRFVPRCYAGWPVDRTVLLYSNALTGVFDTTSVDWDSRRAAHRPLIGGICVAPPISAGGGGGGTPDFPWWEVLGQEFSLATDQCSVATGIGTLGMVTYDGRILSAAHVIAYDGSQTLDIGTFTYQPDDTYPQAGELQQVMPIVLSITASNYADAAVSTIADGVTGDPGVIFSEDGGSYTISGWTVVNEGDQVRKSGIMTGVTNAEVFRSSGPTFIEYDDQNIARFVDQVLVISSIHDPFLFFGDSGSVVDKNGEFVGLCVSMHYCRPESGFCICREYGLRSWWPWSRCQEIQMAFVSKAEYIIDEFGIQLSPYDGGGGGGGDDPPMHLLGGKESS